MTWRSFLGQEIISCKGVLNLVGPVKWTHIIWGRRKINPDLLETGYKLGMQETSMSPGNVHLEIQLSVKDEQTNVGDMFITVQVVII